MACKSCREKKRLTREELEKRRGRVGKGKKSKPADNKD